MDTRPYGEDALFVFPLVDAGAQDFATTSDYTPAAGDLKLFTDAQLEANPTGEVLAFTSGSEEPSPGDTLVGATSTETAVVMFVVRTSGTWAGGDAAGWLFLKSVSGVLQAEDLNISGGSSNVMSIGGDSTAGIPAYLGGSKWAVALTAAEMSCKWGQLTLVDSATKAVEDQFIDFDTEGHPSAQHPYDGLPSYELVGAGTPQAAGATTVTLPSTASSDDDAYNAVLLAEVGVGVKLCYGSYVGSTKVFMFDPAPGVTFTTGATVWPLALPASPTSDVAEVTLGSAGQAAVRTALGMASADLDTQLDAIAGYIDTEIAAIKAKTDNLPASPAAVGDAMTLAGDAVDAAALAADAVAEIVAGVFARTFDATKMSGLTFEELVALIGCIAFAKVSGLETTTGTFRNIGDTANAVQATVDADGNRSAITITLASVR